MDLYNDIWVFDLDGTLVESKQNRVELMMQEKSASELGLGIEYYYSKTYNLFESLIKDKKDVFILTARHPFFKEQIQEVMKGVTNVFCRDYCLDLPSIKLAYENVKEKTQFYQDMLTFKCRKLNELSFLAKRVMFVEDYASEFNKRETIPSPFGVGGTTTVPILNGNVYPMLPFHITDGGNTFEGAIQYFKDTGQIR